MSLKSYSDQELLAEIDRRKKREQKQHPIDTRLNHTMLQRDSKGRFTRG